MLLTGCSTGSDTTAPGDSEPAAEPGQTTSTVPQSDERSDDGTTSTDEVAANTDEGTASDPIDVEPVVAAAELAAGAVSGKPFAIESDDHNGQEVWEVSLAVDGTEVTVWVNTDGTGIVDQERDDDPDDDPDDGIELLATAEVSAVEALRAAAPRLTGAFEEMELDSRDGTVVWEIEIDRNDGTDFEVLVDAVSGEVLDG